MISSSQKSVRKLLCLSNGHGEDAIAVRILEELQRQPHAPELAALPIVGEGRAYTHLNIPIIGTVEPMPSGGFIYMDGRQLWRDLKSGLIGLTLTQLQAVRQWSHGEKGVILAVGDIVPLLFAWASGADYAFVGTAKSEYYLRDEAGWLPTTSKLEKALGSVYLPWERWLMSQKRCKAVFPRDKLTAEILQQQGISAFDLGNPMMDDLTGNGKINEALKQLEQWTGLKILLLPGSRRPEAEYNWQKIVKATKGVIAAKEQVLFLGAIAPGLSLEPFIHHLEAEGWQLQQDNVASLSIEDVDAAVLRQKNAIVVLTQTAYQDCLQAADLAIAMAGTATEQFVGLGKVAIAIPGNGPQFTPAFAEAQTRLLGPSVILANHPDEVADRIKSILENQQQRELIASNGRRRMGSPGAAARIANCLKLKLIVDS